MKTKKFNHNKKEQCKISKKDIDTDKDNYSVVLDYVGDSISSIGFYKTELLVDLIKGKTKEIEKSFIERIQKTIGNTLGTGFMQQPKKEEVEYAV